MAGSSFVGYVGDPDFHDGSVVATEHDGGIFRVRVRGASGTVFRVDFGGVRAVRANHPEGMVIYALTELSGEPPVRCFSFANWDDEGSAYLQVDAETIAVREEATA